MADEVKTLVWNDFSGGWIPDNDAVNGGKNALLQMDNVDLDINGALRLQQGCDFLYFLVGNTTPMCVFSLKKSDGTVHIYFSNSIGQVIKDNAVLFAGGDLAITAFCAAFNYVLICSNFQRWKESSTGVLVTLGITITPAPSAIVGGVWRTNPLRSDSGASDEFVNVLGLWALNGGGLISLQGAFPAVGASQITNTVIIQSYIQHQPAGVTIPFNWARLDTTLGPSYLYPTPNTIFGQATDNDWMDFQITFSNVIPDRFFHLTSIILDFLLIAPGPGGTQVSDFYSANWVNPNADLVSTENSIFNIRLLRSDFQRVGNNNLLNWSTVYGYRITINESKISDTVGAFCNVNIFNLNGFQFSGGSTALGGNVEYATQAINDTGQYVGKAELSPASVTTTLGPDPFIYTSVHILRPIDSQATGVWLYRRGNNLGQWYRVAAIPLSSFGSTSIDWLDFISDSDAQTINITYNVNLKSITAGTITDKIYDILGPIEGRWYYFTTGFMYPSDSLNPDLVDVSLSIRTIAAQDEVYMWAKKVNDSIVLVGTTKDIYILKGTFATLADGTIDIYYVPLSVSFPPINRNAVVYSGTVYYLASDGWRSVDPSGANASIIGAATDLLYFNQPRYKYAPHFSIGWTDFQIRPIAVFQNKLIVGISPITGPFRFEVYDITRKYWRVIQWAFADTLNGVCNTLSTLPDGRLLMGFADSKIRTYPSANKFLDGNFGAGGSQPIDVLSPVFDNGSPRNRKDSLTLKLRVIAANNPPNDPFNLALILSDNSIHNFPLSNNTTGAELFFDLSDLISKTYQFHITGSGGDFLLQDITIDYEPRPLPLTELILRNDNFGTSSKKRLRARAYEIDTLGNDVTYQGFTDGVLSLTQIINTTDKRTVDVYWVTDEFGTDYGAKLLAAAGHEFEFYGEVQGGLIVETAPQGRKFDQVGPLELFKYGRCKEFVVRILSLGGANGTTSVLPYRVYMDDDSLINGTFDLRNQHDTNYGIILPKGIGGTVLRITFGPVDFVFCRYYIMAKLLKTGVDTDNVWVPIGANSE